MVQRDQRSLRLLMNDYLHRVIRRPKPLTAQDINGMSDTNDEKAHYLRKDGEEKLSGTLSKFKGREYFSFRTWYRTEGGEGGSDEWKPGKNGLNLPMDEAEEFLGVVIETFGLEKMNEIMGQYVMVSDEPDTTRPETDGSDDT